MSDRLNMGELLAKTLSLEASDMHLKTGAPPTFRIDGELVTDQEMAPISAEEMEELFEQIADEAQRRAFASDPELDIAHTLDGTCRFRFNVCRHGGNLGISCRPFPNQIPTIKDLRLPKICESLALKTSGLVIVTGPTGSGKSTTLAAMISYMNQETRRKVVTVEDPIEFIHVDNQCVIFQREVGSDTTSFSSALRHALRQDPDVILVGEIRDLETMATTLTAAETGHLVLTTLHTSSAAQAIDRCIDIFPPHQQEQVRVQLSLCLQGVLYQTLIPMSNGRGRVPAVEVMTTTEAVSNLIREAKTYQLRNAMQTGAQYGMQTLDQALLELSRAGVISREDAVSRSANQKEMDEMVKQPRMQVFGRNGRAGER